MCKKIAKTATLSEQLRIRVAINQIAILFLFKKTRKMAKKRTPNTDKFWKLIQDQELISIDDWANAIERVPLWCDVQAEDYQYGYPAHKAAVKWLLECEVGEITQLRTEYKLVDHEWVGDTPEHLRMPAYIVNNSPVTLLALSNLARFTNKEEARVVTLESIADNVFGEKGDSSYSIATILEYYYKIIFATVSYPTANGRLEQIILTQTAILINRLDRYGKDPRPYPYDYFRRMPTQTLIDKITKEARALIRRIKPSSISDTPK